MCPHHQQEINFLGDMTHRTLTILCGVANVSDIRANDGGKAFFEGINDFSGIIHREGGLADVGEFFLIFDGELLHIIDIGDQIDIAMNASHRSFHFGMPFVSDENHFIILFGILLSFLVHFGDQRTCGIQHGQSSHMSGIFYFFGNAVGTENGDTAIGDFIQFFHKDCTFFAECLHHSFVMDDFMTHIDRRAVFSESTLHDFNGALHTGTKAARLCQHDF